MDKSTAEFLKLYREIGLAVVPAVFGQKRPEVEWKEFQTKAPSKSQVDTWFSDGKDHNIAVLCGEPSQNLVVLDFDDVSVYPAFFAKTAELEKETLVVRTGSGKIHVYLRSDKPIPSFSIPQLKLEVRSSRNLVIAPPSKHPSGGFYSFVNLEVQKILTVTDLVESVWQFAEKAGVKPPTDLFREETEEWRGEPYVGPDPPCIVNMLKGVAEGARNMVAMRLASFWLRFRQGVDVERVLGRLKHWNRSNKPPLPEKELKSIAESAAKLDRSYGCQLNQAWCDLNTCVLMRNKKLRTQADAEAEQILTAPNVLEAITPHLDNIIAGEDENKKLEFELLSSGKYPDPAFKQLILLKSEPGAGKTHLMRLADAFRTKNVGRFTAHALDYTDLQDYEVLRLKELGAMDEEFQGVSTLKFLSADDRGYTVEVTERDERGRFKTTAYTIPPITVITSTTRVQLDPQFERRSWPLNPDESKEQTDLIRQWKVKHEQEKAQVALGLLPETSYDHSLRVLRAIVKKLEPVAVILPFPDALTSLLRTDKLRVRGDYDKFLSLAKLHGFIHQRTLPRVKTKNGSKVVFLTPRHCLEVLKIAEKPYVTMAMELEQRSRRLISVMEELGLKDLGVIVDKDARGKIAVKLSLSSKTVLRYLSDWADAGYMGESKTTSKGRPLEFQLLYPLEEIKEKATMTLDIAKKSEEIVSKFGKEAEKFLDFLGTQISYGGDWTAEKVRQALTSDLVETALPREIRVQREPEADLGVSRQIEPLTSPNSPMSKVTPTVSESKPEIKPSTAVTIENILAWLRLEFQQGHNPILEGPKPIDPIVKGTCPLCQQRSVSLPWQVQFVDGSRIDACCLSCGGKINDVVDEFRVKGEV